MTARGTARLLAAALIVAGIQMNTMYHRINDLECQRDIYKSRSESWEREASGWHDVTMQLGELTDDLREELKSKEQSLPANFTMEYAGDFLCTSYCTEKREHICGTEQGSPPAAPRWRRVLPWRRISQFFLLARCYISKAWASESYKTRAPTFRASTLTLRWPERTKTH